MEYSIDAVAGKVVQVIIALSVIIAVGGAVYFRTIEGALTFAVGVAMTMAVNIAKVLLLKRANTTSLTKDPTSARFHLQYTYFLRLVLTAVVLITAAVLHPDYVNFFGAAIGLFTLHISFYSMRYFFRHALADDVMTASANRSSSSTQDAIQEINAIVSEYDETKDGNKK